MSEQALHHWRKISQEPTLDCPSLHGDRESAVTVIGGGLTGLAAALQFAEQGVSVSLLEAGEIGMAASGRNNGQVIPHHSKKSPGEIQTLLGAARGDIYNAMVAEAPSRLFQLIRENTISCDLVDNGWIQACHSQQSLNRARLFQREWEAFGAKTQWLSKSTMADKIGTQSFLGGWKAFDAGHLNPFALTQGLARLAVKKGARLFRQSAVLKIAPEGDRWRVITPDGSVVTDQILIATNALTGDFWPGLRKTMIPVRVFQVATEPLTPAQRESILPNNEGVSDTRRDILAFRYDRDWRMEAVGVHTSWHNAAPRGKAQVLAKLKRTFPQLAELKAAEYWEGTLAVVPDRMPRIMQLDKGVFFAGIYSGRGVAMSTAWGKELAKFMAGTLPEAQLPVPVTGMRPVTAHGIAVQVAKYIHPVHQLQDHLDSVGLTGR
jgi:glycine/D-amino acid oxidase-like deaminating enzyme